MRRSRDPVFAAVDKFGRAIEIGSRIWSSEDVGWQGPRLEIWRMSAAGNAHGGIADCTSVTTCLRGRSRIRQKVYGSEMKATSRRGAVYAISRGIETSHWEWDGSLDLLLMELDLGRNGVAARIVPSSANFIQMDKVVSGITTTMLHAARQNYAGGALFASGMTAALRNHMDGRYFKSAHQCRRAQFTPTEKSKVYEFVYDHMREFIDIKGLAACVNMSSYRFCETFKQTFNETPYQFVLRTKISEGMRLLKSTATPPAEIAVHLGFSDQSHFTRIFRRFAGTTPRAYREG